MSLVRHRHIRSLVVVMLLASLGEVCPPAIAHDATNCIHARADQTAPATVVTCCLTEHQPRGLVPAANQESSSRLVPLPGWTTVAAPMAGQFNDFGAETRATAATPPRFLMTSALLI